MNGRRSNEARLTVPLDQALPTWLDALDGLVAAVERPSERELLGATRCHGWAVVDLVAHLVAGLAEMLHGVTAPVDGPPDRDAATYWDDFPPDDPDDPDALAAILRGRRRGSMASRPEPVRHEFRVVAAAVRRATAGLDDRPRLFQERVLTAGDFLATWVVEVVVHHLDLDPSGRGNPPPTDALRLTRAVVEARAGRSLPSDDDVQVVLVGSGRLPAPDDWEMATVPVLG